MYALFAKVTVKPDQIDHFLKYLEADVAGTRKEPGCVHFDVVRDEKTSNVFYVYEVYRDRDAYAVHKEAPYFKAFFAEAGGALMGPPEGFFGDTILEVAS